MKKATFTINGYKLRLDQIKIISPLMVNKSNLDGIFGIFIRDSKKTMISQYYFTIIFIGRDGGYYQEFSSEIVNYIGFNNFKGDIAFKKEYEKLVVAWENYHNNLSQIL